MKFSKPIAVMGFLALCMAFTGCLNDGGRDGETRLSVVAGVKDVNKTTRLGKTSVITLNKLVVTLVSSVETDPVIRDTILAGPGSGFGSTATVDQSYSKSYAVKPLRNWTIVVKTLDVNDSIVHYDSVVAVKMLVGETRPIEMNLVSRFVMYEAKFTVPDSLRSTTSGTAAQKIIINRFVMVVDGDTLVIADSTTGGGFAPGMVHTVRFDYIRVNGTPDVELLFYGQLEGVPDDGSPLFKQVIENVDPTNPNPHPGTAHYVGPGSGGTAGGHVGLTINIGKVGTVTFEPGFEEPDF